MAVQTHMNLRGNWQAPVPDFDYEKYRKERERRRSKTKHETKTEFDQQEHLKKAYESNKAAEEAKFQRENKGLAFQEAGQKERRPATVSPANPLTMQQKRPPEVISAEQFSGREQPHTPIPPEQHRAPTVQPFSNPIEETQQPVKKPRKRVRTPEMQEPGGAKTGGAMPKPEKAPRTKKGAEESKAVSAEVASPFNLPEESSSMERSLEAAKTPVPPPPAAARLMAMPTFSSPPPDTGNKKYR